MKHLDLFSGIGGFALACRWAGVETVGFVEIDKFCQKILNKHWPEVPIIEDIRDVKENTFPKPVDLITGGFPCQPFSQAGKRGGSTDDRFLWPAMLSVIETYRPTWVLGENVAGITTLEEQDSLFEVENNGNGENCAASTKVIDRIWSDFEGINYEVQAFVIPACAINFPHRRDRIWIVAHSKSEYGNEYANEPSREVPAQGVGSNKPGRCYMPRNDYSFNIKGRDVLESAICRKDDGLPSRVDRLKSLGNAIVPQVAYQIIKFIAEIENKQELLL